MKALLHELEAAKEARRRHEKLTADRRCAAEALARAERELNEQGAVLDRESADVRKLEGVSLTRFFVELFGDRDERLDRERKELAAAKLRYDERLSATEALTGEIAELDAVLAELGDVDARYRDVLSRREAALRREATPLARELTDLAEQIADARADARELDEAALVAEEAEAALRETKASLGHARSWGAVDMLGGGILVTMAKHNRLDKARASAERAQRALRRLDRELSDIGQRLRSSFEVGGVLTFADYFFDGLLADWLMQSRVAAAQDRVAETIDRVRGVRDDLRRAARENTGRLAELEQRRETLLGGG